MKPLKSRKTILRVAVPDDLGCDLRLQAVPGEGLLQDVGGGRRVRAFAQVEVVALWRDGASGEYFQRLLRGRDLPGEGSRAFEHPDHAQLLRFPGVGILHSQVEVVRQFLVVGVEAGQLDWWLHRGAEGRDVTLGRQVRGDHDRDFGLESFPYLARRAVAFGGRPETVADAIGVAFVHPLHEEPLRTGLSGR
jgi:hypothetical protein